MKLVLCCVLCLWMAGVASSAQSAPDSALLQKAQAGDATAEYELGRMYEDGTATPKDDAQAAQWYQKAAAQDYPAAENGLGVMYSLGHGVNRSPEEAVSWYRKAAKHGLSEALYNLAISYYNGEGVGGNLDLAYAFMQVAQSKGNPQATDALQHITDELQGHVEPAQLKLAQMYEQGQDVPQDFTSAAKLYQELADLGVKHAYSYGPAEFALCRFYAEGKGVPQNYAEAISRCKVAAKNGIGLAYVVLGKMTAAGLGTEKNTKKALEYYQIAAVEYVPESFMELGKFEMQSGKHEDAKQAYFWFYLARQHKVPNAETELESAAAQLSEREIAFAQRKADQWRMLPLPDRSRKVKLQ